MGTSFVPQRNRGPRACEGEEVTDGTLALWRLVDALIAALPQCDSGCHATKSCPATKSWGRGTQRYCDECAGSRIPDYPRAAPLRALLAARDARKKEGAK